MQVSTVSLEKSQSEQETFIGWNRQVWTPWRPLCLHKEAMSGEYPCSEVSCWNANYYSNFIFRSSTQFVRYYPNFLYSSLYSLPVISKLEHFLADVAVFPSSTLTAGFQCLRHFQARLFPRRSSCGQKGLGSRLRTGLPTVQFLKLQHFGQKL